MCACVCGLWLGLGAPGGSEILVNNFRTALEPWVQQGKRVTVHTVGFSADHDYEFLNKLRAVGTSEVGCVPLVHPPCDLCGPVGMHLCFWTWGGGHVPRLPLPLPYSLSLLPT